MISGYPSIPRFDLLRTNNNCTSTIFTTMNNAITAHSENNKEHSQNETFYKNLSGSPYFGWVNAYQRGCLTKGQVKYRVQSWIRMGRDKGALPTVSYKEWLEWMKYHHDNAFDHILK